VAFLGWLLIWKGTFGIIEQGASLLGLVTISFLVAAVKLDPPLPDLAAGLLPSLPAEQAPRYWFLAVSIFGACVTPYLFYFYSSGAIEDRWDEKHLGTNRFVATVGMTFGAVLSLAVLVVAAMVLAPRAIQIEGYEQVALMLTDPLPGWGFFLFAASLGIACFGAAVEIILALAYLVAQGFGWNWGANLAPARAARFSVTYTVIVALAALVVLTGIDPLKLTNVSMALTAAVLPVAIAPFLVLMNDAHYMRQHTNGWLGNAVVLVTMTLASVVAVVVVPLEIFGG
jgi:Mn2+/Fe2+ NRAMP family transporter